MIDVDAQPRHDARSLRGCVAERMVDCSGASVAAGLTRREDLPARAGPRPERRLGQDERPLGADGERDAALAAGARTVDRPTIRPSPYSGWSTETPGWKASRSAGPALAAREVAARWPRRGRRRSSGGTRRGGRSRSCRSGWRGPVPARPAGGRRKARRPRGRGRPSAPRAARARNREGMRRLLLAPERPDAAPAQVELAAGPGDADEQEPPLLLQLAACSRWRGRGAGGPPPGPR